ncbi:MAG: rhodanese-like domain-containing protein [Reichenbachiella sp.]|uniref:MBL fold metallo-hydrolase n=1 Tax=Reichenbachiella sp. TaxID=2184521 RepID=UPI003263D001
MKIEQIYTGCLAQGAYYIQSENEAIIIDPLREIEPYLAKARKNEATIKYIFETHFHADFVSGHVDLAKKTGAKIVFGPTAKTDFESHIAFDGEVFEIGKIKIKVLHTPGHTMESSTFLLMDENDKDYAIFSGDTLFIGDVGRPDLAVKTELSKEDLAGHLYDSLANKIMPLADGVLVYPAHGAGSACGKNMSAETWDTLGNQKNSNYALSSNLSKQAFINKVIEGIMPPPQYFPKNAKLNKTGYQSFEKVLEAGLVPLDLELFETIVNDQKALIVDTRHESEFIKSHIPNSIFIGLDGSFAVWVGALIADLEQPIVFLADEGREEEVLTRLSRVGYDNTLGYLKGGMKTWIAAERKIDSVTSIDPTVFEVRVSSRELRVLDVRKPAEYEVGHVKDAINFPLDFINENMAEINPDEKVYLHCASGFRSVIAASILKARGFHNIVNVEQGYQGICETEIEVREYQCTSS